MDTNFVVYSYIREDGTPYYIGKGKPNRPYIKNGGRACSTPPLDKIIILYENLNESTAFKIEKELIAKYKRKDLDPINGLLYNRSDGGEGASGRIVSEETRKRLSLVQSVLHDWYHPIHGEVLQKSISELTLLFPDLNLKKNCLRKVSSGLEFKHKGWILLKNRGKERRNKNSIPRDWYHPIYGEVLQKSAMELTRIFPDQKLHASALNLVALGKSYSHKGWRDLKKEKVEKPRRKSNILRDWYHPVYGVILQKSCTQLAETFPDQRLSTAKLSCVALGKTYSHKGWRELKNKEKEKPKRKSSIPRNWYHPDHGEVLQKSISELISLFPEQNLNSGNLSQVALGNKPQHKGWKT